MINHQLNSAYNDEANNSDYASKPMNNNNYIYHNKKTKRDQKENIDKDIYPLPNKRPKLDYIDSNLFSYITKNGKMKLLYKLEIPFDEVKADNIYTAHQTFKSIRKDDWTLLVQHEFFNKLQGGKISLQIKIEKDSQSFHEEILSSLSKVFSSLTFSIELSINILNYKTHSISIPPLGYHTLSQPIDIAIPSEYYSNFQNKNLPSYIILLELTVTKTYQNIISLPYNGIFNEGATCYVNSMLQTLNSICSFKKAVFQIPTENDDYSSVALSLQRLFYDLMTNHSPVSAKILLNSFGWSQEQIQIQHDVQEFNLLLSDVMQNKMKGTSCDGAYNSLFEGKLMNYIQCVNVDYHSERIEKFVDLQLTIKNYKNIYQSLDAYTEEEILDNDDKYETEGYGKQKAKKGIRFISFPPVLTMQLKRFEYNSKKEIMVKINDYFEFYDEIDLSKYIYSKDNNTNDDNKYILHSVVVHQGNANSGHYFAFIKPTMNKGDWLQFNDEVVKPADNYEVFNQNYGGNYEVYKHKGKGEIISNNVNYERTAYVLVYMKKSIASSLLEPVSINSIPVYLRKRFEKEKEEEENNTKKKKRNAENVNILLISNINCFNHVNKIGIVNSFLDLNVDAPLIYNNNYRMLISFPKNLTFGDFLDFISDKANIPNSHLLLYEYENCENMQILSRQDYDLKFISNFTTSINDYKSNNKKTFLSLFLYVKGDYILFTNINAYKDFNEEIPFNDKVIYIPKAYNKYCFKINADDSMKQNNRQAYIDENLNRKIIFIKKYDTTTKTLSFDKIIDITLDKKADIIYNGIVSQLQSTPTKIIIERTSPIEILDESNSLNTCENFLTASNALTTLLSVSSLVIIPVYQNQNFDDISAFINSLYLTLYVDFYTQNSIRLIKKMKIELRQTLDEFHLRELILKQLKEKHLLPSIVNSKDHYYINQSRQMMLLTEDLLKDYLSPDNLELFDDSEPSQRQNSETREFKILSLLNLTECRFYFKLSLFKLSDVTDFYYQDIYLYDINNNEICLISALIPKKMKKCCEVLDYLYDILQSKFGCGYMKKNYYFILQSETHNFAYQIITDDNIDFKQYENKAKDIEYRLQPYLDSDINKMYNPEYKKVFITFSETQYKFMPIISYFQKNEKFSKIKEEIEQLISKNKKYDSYIQEKCILEFQIHKAIIMNGKVLKDTNILIKSEDTIESLYKDFSGAINLYIELI